MAIKGKILAVDDTPASLKLLTEILQAEGYEVRSAISGEMALRSATINPPELILLDVRMPVMDGFEVCRRLKAQPETRDVPIIFVSALSETNEKVEGLELGAVDFVSKPYQREELLIRVRTHLEITRLRNRLEFLVEERTLELKASLAEVASREEALRLAERKREDMLQTLQEGVVTVDVAGQITYSNQAAREILELDRDVDGKYFQSLKWRPLDERGDTFPQDQLPLAIALREQNRLLDVEHRIIAPDGKTKWLSVNAAPLFDESDKLSGAVASFRDITEHKAAEAKIERLAFYDPLTHLPNRSLMLDRLQQALASSLRSENIGALLFIDLDDFKTLNDTLGHDMGDLLLQKVAERLTTCIREGDTVSRLGGDEFVVMLEGLSTDKIEAAEQTQLIANKIISTLNNSYQLNSHAYRCTASIGATLFTKLSAEEHMKKADIAMYQAKKAGRNTLRFFDPEMQASINARAELERELRLAIEQQQFHLYYQVQVDASRQALGAEVLIRWLHPERGLISPGDFIQLAEECGLILPIGKWVLETACAQLKSWQGNAHTRKLTLSVNVSAKQFQEKNFVEQLRNAVQRHTINPTLLKLEPTESILLENIEEALATMNGLKEIGVHFSLDDFGTGYSSLQYLKKLPLNQLKIDQSFVRDLVSDSNDQVIVRTIIVMAQSLNLDVIAEGVETEEQLQILHDQGCNHYQGYLFGRPVPIDEFEAQLKRGSV